MLGCNYYSVIPTEHNGIFLKMSIDGAALHIDRSMDDSALLNLVGKTELGVELGYLPLI